MKKYTILLVLLGCSSDSKIITDHIAPAVAIQIPGSVFEYSETTMVAQITYDGDVSALGVTWSLDGSQVCPDASVGPADDGGITSCAISVGQQGEYNVGIIVSDNRSSGSDSLDLSVEANPLQFRITSPTDESLYTVGDDIFFIGEISLCPLIVLSKKIFCPPF